MQDNEKALNDYSPSIFVIDDEEVVVQVIQIYLEEAGYSDVHVFTDPVEAFETLSRVKADLVLTDVNMPELGGKFLTKLARRVDHLKETPIVAITADKSESTRNNLLGNGVTEVMVKPIDRELLLSVVRGILKFQKLAAANTLNDLKRNRAKSFSIVSQKEKSLREAFDRK